MLNNQVGLEELEELSDELGPNLKNRLITRQEGLLAGGTTDFDIMNCPSVTQKIDEVCKDCTFSGLSDRFVV